MFIIDRLSARRKRRRQSSSGRLGGTRRCLLENLESRELLATLVSSPIQLEADNVGQFAPGAPGSYEFETFLGAEFDTGVATVGGIIPVIETGLEAKLGLNGRIGFEIGVNISPGSISSHAGSAARIMSTAGDSIRTAFSIAFSALENGRQAS